MELDEIIKTLEGILIANATGNKNNGYEKIDVFKSKSAWRAIGEKRDELVKYLKEIRIRVKNT